MRDALDARFGKHGPRGGSDPEEETLGGFDAQGAPTRHQDKPKIRGQIDEEKSASE